MQQTKGNGYNCSPVLLSTIVQNRKRTPQIIQTNGVKTTVSLDDKFIGSLFCVPRQCIILCMFQFGRYKRKTFWLKQSIINQPLIKKNLNAGTNARHSVWLETSRYLDEKNSKECKKINNSKFSKQWCACVWTALKIELNLLCKTTCASKKHPTRTLF